MTETCPDCGEEFERLASHIAQSDCERNNNAVGADAEKEEAKGVPSVAEDEHVAVSFEPAEFSREELEDLIEEINDARRNDEQHEYDEHYDDLHDELRSRKE